jgi:hypothetical protein
MSFTAPPPAQAAATPPISPEVLVIVSVAAASTLPALVAAVVRAGRRDVRVLLVPAQPQEDCDPDMVIAARVELARCGCAVPVMACSAGAQALAAQLAALGTVRVVSLPEVRSASRDGLGREGLLPLASMHGRDGIQRLPGGGSAYAAPPDARLARLA